jgi:hypothetical protein
MPKIGFGRSNTASVSAIAAARYLDPNDRVLD